MRNKTREAMRLFLGGRCYTAEKLEKDYLAEVANYSNDRWEAPQRAARLAASVKRYKTSEMLRFIFATIAYDPDPDLTPLTVRRLCKALFIDRNLNPQKTKKAPQNGCFFNTPCAPYERKRLLNRMTLIDTGYEWRFFAPFPVKWTQLPLCGSQPHTCCRASRSCIRTSSASR